MILSPTNIELTKIHYYDEKIRRQQENLKFSSREHTQNEFNKNVIIKRNVFGRRWVLKINETDRQDEKEKKTKVVVYVLVFCSIIVAVGFGIFLSFDKRLFQNSHEIENNDVPNNSENIANITEENFNSSFQDSAEDMSESEFNETSKETKNTAKNTFCTACIRDQEICLKVHETGKPECVKAEDLNDPTGCGGLCQIGTHYCQILDRNSSVYQCSILKTTLACSNGTFSCGNMCVLGSSRCDGILDCSDGSDEKNCDCDLKTHFHCGNSTSCLELSRKCDQNLDCWDKSDEVDCVKGLKCPEDEFPCVDSHCIPKENFCDGNFDCPDRSDEPVGCQVIH
ncbi:unnamed protein product [Phaedon cochleariae]|uniref:Uncharacterized protein n=1 Tax=Phaedon cochleariae TaxID=80249 RepID=A0A9N9SAC2_PHACE|nr:unnamed protein product [Phaedon cochleariae]